MQSSSLPTLVPLPWANSGLKRAIPTASQILVTPGAASLTDGFPPLTFTDTRAGGIPPSGLDWNGVLNLLSANTQWENAGGFYPYSSSFATSIGGYPKGAILARADATGFWLSTAENNSINPETDTTGAWVPVNNSGITAITGLTNANVTLTALQYSKRIITLAGTLTGNVQIIFPAIAGLEWTVVNGTTGAFTVTAKTATGTGGVIASGYAQRFRGGGMNLVPDAGNASQILAVANAVGASDALNKGQSYISATAQSMTASRAIGTTYTNDKAYPIWVYISANTGTAMGNMYLNIGSLKVDESPSNTTSTLISVSGMIPPGATYSVSTDVASLTLVDWNEVR